MGSSSILQTVFCVGGEIQSATLSKVLYVPEIKKNLFSVVSCVAAGNNLRFTEKGVQIFNNKNKLVGLGHLRDGLWHLKSVGGLHYANMANSAANASIWHRRLGHLSAQNLQLLKSKSLVKGLEEVDLSGLEECEGCSMGKQTRLPAHNSQRRASKKLELVHSDICGPINPKSIGGAKYFITFIDDATRKVWVYVLKSRDGVFQKFPHFKAMMEKQSGEKLKSLRSDNGGEYKSEIFQNCCKNEVSHKSLLLPTLRIKMELRRE